MPRFKVGDVCRIKKGVNVRKICEVLRGPMHYDWCVESFWEIQMLEPCSAFKRDMVTGDKTEDRQPLPAGHTGLIGESFLEPLPPPDQEDITETEKELENV